MYIQNYCYASDMCGKVLKYEFCRNSDRTHTNVKVS